MQRATRLDGSRRNALRFSALQLAIQLARQLALQLTLVRGLWALNAHFLLLH